MGLPFHLRCLGRPQLISPGGEPVRFRVRKHLAMLVYLALEPRIPQRRERIADLLWPNVSPTDGRHSVATAVSVLRGKLGREMIEGDRDHVQLVGSNLTLDLERLAAGNILGDEYLPVLDVGGFLDDFDINDAPEYMIWLERQRARWLPSVRDALVLLIDRCRRTGDFRRIEQLGNSLLDIDELSEDGIRAKMEARAFDGDRVTALKIFQNWKVKLAQELEAVPSQLIEGMAIRLRQRGWEQVSLTNIPAVPTDQWRGRPFIGRAKEYEELYSAWESTLKQLPQHVLVLGDSGMGKSTLIERAVTATGLEGAAISRVQCYELEREIPYAAMGSLIEGLLDRPGASGTAPEWLAELARTVPQIRRRFPGIPEGIDTQGETARIRLTEAVRQLALSISEEHPVILVLDDVHLADDASLAVLHLMMRRTLDKSIMVLMAARSSELGQSPHAAKLVEGHGYLRIGIVELHPMSREETELLLDSFIPADTDRPTESTRRALLETAVGVPMVLEYLVKDWLANRDQCIALSIGAMTEEPHTPVVPSQAYHLIFRRLSQGLEPTTSNVLCLAAILGPRLNDISLYSIADVSIGEIMAGMGKLVEHRILRDNGHNLEFCNELVRGEAYLAVPSGVRRMLHGKIAERLLILEESGHHIPGLEIAWHLIRAGQTEDATPYLLRGSREAMRRGAPHEAERSLGSGIGHLKEPEKTDALLLLAETLHEQGKWANVLATLGTCDIRPNDGREDVRTLLSTEPRRRLELISNVDEDLTALDLLRIAESANTSIHIRARALSNASYLLVDKSSAHLSERLSSAVDTLPWDTLTLDDLPHAAVARAILCYNVRDVTGAEGILLTAIDKLQGRGISNLATTSLFIALGNVYSSAGKYAEALKHNTIAFDLGMKIGNDALTARIAGNNAMCALRLGHLDEAVGWSRQALARDGMSDADVASKALCHSSLALALQGKVHETERQLTNLQSLPDRTRSQYIRQNCYLFAADILSLLERPREALVTARKGTRGGLARPCSVRSAGIFARWLVASVEDGRDRERVSAIVREILDLRNLDKIDKAEALCASLHLERDDNIRRATITTLRSEMKTLPEGVWLLFRRMNVLPYELTDFARQNDRSHAV